MKKRWTAAIGGVLLTLPLLGFQTPDVNLQHNDAISNFPESIVFQLAADSSTVITEVELEYWTDALVCGDGVTRAVPRDVTPGKSIEAEWVWNLKRTGPLPPGTSVGWRWRISDASGEILVTPDQQLLFDDPSHPWQQMDSGYLSLYWYEGSNSFAQSLLNAGVQALANLEAVTGVTMEAQIKVHVYASSEEMQAATLFAPAWSGGHAFPRRRIVLIGVPTSSLSWGRRVMRHELSHVLIGHYIFSCVGGYLPTWLEEGLAMHAEGPMGPFYDALLTEAIKDDRLFSVEELGGGFSNDPELASLSYAQSQSLVEFLIEAHGQEQMLALLDRFKAGSSEDQALKDSFGFNRDGLEAAWRDWVGAAPLADLQSADATPTHTPYPTLPPISGPAVLVTHTPTADADSMLTPTATPRSLAEESLPDEASTAPVAVKPLVLAGAAAVFILLISTLALITRKARRRKDRG